MLGEYEIYTVLSDGSEHIFRKVTVKENVELAIKLKYDVVSSNVISEEDDFNWIWIIIAGSVSVIVAGAITILLLKKRKILK